MSNNGQLTDEQREGEMAIVVDSILAGNRNRNSQTGPRVQLRYGYPAVSSSGASEQRFKRVLL